MLRQPSLRSLKRDVERIIGCKVHNGRRLWEAFQAPGLAPTAGFPYMPDGNRKLALIGDAALKLVVVEEMYQKQVPRERLNIIASRLISNDNLVRVGTRHGLDAFVNRNRSSPEVSPVTMAATVEAIIGAVYLDGGMTLVSKACRTLGLMPHLERSSGMPKPSDFPTKLKTKEEVDAEWAS